MSKKESVEEAQKRQEKWRTTRLMVIFAVIIVICIPFLIPLKIPTASTEYVKAMYNTVQNLPAGSIVVFEFNIAAGEVGTFGPGTKAVLQQLFNLNRERGVKILIMNFGSSKESDVLLLNNFLPLVDKYNAVYGVDWVFLGFYPGGETAYLKLCTDAASLFTEDFYGAPVSQLPIVSLVKNAYDVGLFISTCTGAIDDMMVRQIWLPFQRPMVFISTSFKLLSLISKYKAGQCRGFMATLDHAAEYELLTNLPWKALGNSDAMAAISTFTVVAIIFQNLLSYRTKLKKVGVK